MNSPTSSLITGTARLACLLRFYVGLNSVRQEGKVKHGGSRDRQTATQEEVSEAFRKGLMTVVALYHQ